MLWYIFTGKKRVFIEINKTITKNKPTILLILSLYYKKSIRSIICGKNFKMKEF